MTVEELGEIYRCNTCGNEVKVVKVGGGKLVCCGQDMELIEEKPAAMPNIGDSGG